MLVPNPAGYTVTNMLWRILLLLDVTISIAFISIYTHPCIYVSYGSHLLFADQFVSKYGVAAQHCLTPPGMSITQQTANAIVAADSVCASTIVSPAR